MAGAKRRVGKEKPTTDRQVFAALAENAFEFLARSIYDFEALPKFSVVHFCAAVEMLLKARLMTEHWSLIVAKPEQASRAEFLKGNFISVNLEQTWSRLRDVVGLQLPDLAFKSFQECAKHRNKLIHFFHPDLLKDEQARAQIVSEQARAWFHLRQLLIAWPEFKSYEALIANAETGLRKHRKYLDVKFEALKPELVQLAEQGRPIRRCEACDYDAVVGKSLGSVLSNWGCKMCEDSFVTAEVRCPLCDQEALVSADKICFACQGEMETEQLVDALIDPVKAHIAIRDGDDTFDEGNCSYCDGYHTLVNCDDRYFCAECFEISETASRCQWCNELNNADMENSYIEGCSVCEGYAGHSYGRDD